MATVPSSTLPPHNSHFLNKPHAPPRFTTSPFTTRATSDDSNPDPTESAESSSEDFDSKLSQIRLRYRSGTGKKAEVRKTKKGKKTTSSSSVFLPPVPLKEPVSGGLKVDFGFSPYSERINGRVAGLGLAALLLVELATGKSVIRYHSPAIVFVQVYFVATVAALFVKYEKERVSVWPQSAPPPPNQE